MDIIVSLKKKIHKLRKKKVVPVPSPCLDFEKGSSFSKNITGRKSPFNPVDRVEAEIVDELISPPQMPDDAEPEGCKMTIHHIPEKRCNMSPHVLDENDREKIPEYEEIKGSITPVLEKGRIEVKKGSNDCWIEISDDTIRLFEDDDRLFHVLYKHPQTILRFLDSPPYIEFKADAIVGESQFWLFENLGNNLEERFNTIVEYGHLTRPQQDYIKKRKRDARNIKNVKLDREEEIYRPFVNREQLKMLYSMCKDTYPKHIQAAAESILYGPYNRRWDEEEQAMTELSCYLGIDTSPVEREKVSYDDIMSRMNSRICGQQEPKEFATEYTVESQYTNKTGFVLTIVGPPGTGKTSFAYAIAEALHCKLIQINCGVYQSIGLTGSSRHYSNAKLSDPIEKIRECGSTDVVLLFDEIEDMVSDEEGTGYSVLVDLLGEHRYKDNFLGEYIDMSNARIVITSNDLSRIPKKIRDRLNGRKIVLSGYDWTEKSKIGKFILPRELEKRRLTGEDICFTDAAMDLIAKEYCLDDGARELTANIETLLRKVIVEWERGILKRSRPTIVDEEYVRSHLKKKNRQSTIGFNS